MKKIFKFIIFLIIISAVLYGLYQTSVGRQFIDTRIQEVTNTMILTGSDQSATDTGTIVDPGTPGDPLASDPSTSTTLGKRMEYYRSSKAELGVQ